MATKTATAEGLAIATAPRRPDCIEQLSEWAHMPVNRHDKLAVHLRILLTYTAGLERDLKLAEGDLRAAYRDIDALERKLDAVPDADALVRLEEKLAAANMPLRLAAMFAALTGLALTLAVVL